MFHIVLLTLVYSAYISKSTSFMIFTGLVLLICLLAPTEED